MSPGILSAGGRESDPKLPRLSRLVVAHTSSRAPQTFPVKNPCWHMGETSCPRTGKQYMSAVKTTPCVVLC